MNRWSIACSLLFSMFVATSARADDLADCLACHQAGNRQGEVPIIEGQHVGYLTAQLQRFRDRHRLAFPMDALARGLDDESIARLASALESRPWPLVERSVDAQRAQAGSLLVERFRCTECHGPQFMGGDIIPRLAGQNPGYLARQIASFGSADRYHPPTATGARMEALSAEEAAALAAAISSMGE